MAAPESKTSARRIRAAERTRIALELRKGGATIRQIAKVIGTTTKGAHDALKRGLKQLAEDNIEAADDIRNIEGARLDALFMAVWPKALAGSHSDMDRALRIMERRARLFGIDQDEPPKDTGLLDAVTLGAALARQMDEIDAGTQPPQVAPPE